MDTMSAPEACCMSATTPRTTADRPDAVSTGGRMSSPAPALADILTKHRARRCRPAAGRRHYPFCGERVNLDPLSPARVVGGLQLQRQRAVGVHRLRARPARGPADALHLDLRPHRDRAPREVAGKDEGGLAQPTGVGM